MATETQLLKLQAKLPQILGFNDKCEEAQVTVHSWVRDGSVVVSAEHGDGAGDYYGESRGGYPYIHPTLEAWAKTNNGHWEWVNPGCFAFYVD